MKAGHPVTPSEEVDEVWHLHLCYTRSYWDRMCGVILGKPLHHGPTEGGKKEEEKFADWYARTLESYRVHFGEEPPVDIWPPAEIRFRPVTTRKVDAAKHWIIPKRTTKRVVVGAAAVGMLPVLAGCSSLIAVTEFEGTLFVLVVAVIVIGLIIYAAKKWGNGGNGCGSGCSADSCGGGGSSGCGSNSHGDSGSSGCSSSGCSSGCGGGGCGGGGD